MSGIKKYAAVFTDSRPLMNLDHCAEEHMKFLPKDWDCIFFTSFKNAYVLKMGAKMVEISEDTTDTYQKLAQYRASVDLWTRLLEYDRVLIFEQDTRILRTGIEEFLKWDYVGAAWGEHEKFHRGNRVGNGGLSIRNPAVMLKVCQSHTYQIQDQGEDIFFALNMGKVGANVAPVEVADKFSCEKFFKLGTFGCHAIGKHMSADQVDAVLNQYNNFQGKPALGTPTSGDATTWVPLAISREEELSQKILVKLKRHEEILESLWGMVNNMHAGKRLLDRGSKKQPVRLEETIFKILAKYLLKHSKYPRGVYKQYAPRPLNYFKYQRPKLKKYPSIALITPSLNQGKFIEATIKSVVEQDYPNLDYHVQDGLSKDNTMDIVKAYAKKYNFSYVSEKDKNHSQAINLGFKYVKGDIMGFVNSDDLLCPNALHIVADYFDKHPEVDVIYGHRFVIDENGLETARWYMPKHCNDELRYMCSIPQETMFWRRSIWEKSGGQIDESYYFTLDWEFEVRMQNAGAKFARIPYFLGCFRVHAEHKTSLLWETLGRTEDAQLRMKEFGGKLPRQERVEYFCNYSVVRSFLHQKLGKIF